MTELQAATQHYLNCKSVWKLANAGLVRRNFAVTMLNRARPKLKRAIRETEAYLGREHRV